MFKGSKIVQKWAAAAVPLQSQREKKGSKGSWSSFVGGPRPAKRAVAPGPIYRVAVFDGAFWCLFVLFGAFWGQRRVQILGYLFSLFARSSNAETRVCHSISCSSVVDLPPRNTPIACVPFLCCSVMRRHLSCHLGCTLRLCSCLFCISCVSVCHSFLSFPSCILPRLS